MTFDELNLNNLTEETDVKPNLIMAITVSILMIIDIIALILNEIGVFHIGKESMRICMAVGIAIALFPIICGYNRKIASHNWVKYVNIILIVLLCIGEFIILHLHVYMLCIVPLILSTQYKNMKITRIAAIGTIANVVIAPIIGITSGSWSKDGFILALAQYASKLKYTGGPYDITNETILVRTILYFVTPLTAFIITYSIIMLAVTKANIKALENEIKYLDISRTDSLTGLLNQNYYRQIIDEIDEEGTVGVIFLDINKMKETNDTLGHDFGDILLARCGESIKNITDNDTFAFRIGGDEFLIIIRTDNEKRIDEKISEWKNSLYHINLENKKIHPGLNCEMAFGSAFGEIKNIQELIRTADQNMYKDKKDDGSYRR